MTNVFEIRSGDIHNRERVLSPSTKYCRHGHLVVDQKRALVECKDCGERITPMVALAQMMDRESVYHKHIDTMKDVIEKAKKKNQCKCEKCGQMTRIEK